MTKKITKEITTNKILKFKQSDKENIEKTGDSYFEFDENTIKNLASQDIEKLTRHDWFTLVQALFPDKLICNGLFDSFIIFQVKNGCRIDPPKYYWRDLNSYLNNDNNAKVNKLLEEIKDLFVKNNISWHESWNKYLGVDINNG